MSTDALTHPVRRTTLESVPGRFVDSLRPAVPLLVEVLIGNIVAAVFSRNILDWMPFGAAFQATFLEIEELKFGRFGSLGYFGLWTLAIVLMGQVVLRSRDA